MTNIAQYIESTLLKPDASREDFLKLGKEALEFGFHGICVPPHWLSFFKSEFKNINLITVAGFPFGYESTDAKLKSIETSFKQGASEVDFVINIPYAIEDKNIFIEEEMYSIRKENPGRILKVIFETCYLSTKQILELTYLANDIGIDFVKTSTGYGTGGAQEADIISMSSVVTDGTSIKASGGIRDFTSALQMIQAGATRLGTSSGAKIVREFNTTKGN